MPLCRLRQPFQERHRTTEDSITGIKCTNTAVGVNTASIMPAQQCYQWWSAAPSGYRTPMREHHVVRLAVAGIRGEVAGRWRVDGGEQNGRTRITRMAMADICHHCLVPPTHQHNSNKSLRNSAIQESYGKRTYRLVMGRRRQQVMAEGRRRRTRRGGRRERRRMATTSQRFVEGVNSGTRRQAAAGRCGV